MKRLVLLLLFGVTAGANGFTGDKSLLARVTVYWAQGGHGADQYTRQHKSATGTRLRQGHCAVDPKKIPMGVMLFFPTAQLCQQWTPAPRFGIARLRADRAAPITNETLSLSTNFLRPSARRSLGRTPIRHSLA